MLLADVCANIQTKNINHNFTYIVPEKLKFITAGWRVMVSFGPRTVDGFVIKIYEGNPDDFEFSLKEISDIIDDEAWFTDEMMNSAQWLADFYLCPLSQTMTLFMPGRKGRKIAARYEDIITLKTGIIIDDDFIDSFGRSKKIQIKLLKLLQAKTKLSKVELKEYNISPNSVKRLKEKNLIEVNSRRVLRDSYGGVKPDKKIVNLSDEQKNAIDAVIEYINARQHRGFLLHGVTGSGKTQVYIELTKKTLHTGRRAIILVPEIALTGQIVYEFKRHFDNIIVIHSRLSVDERADAFFKIRSGEVGVVIGARSALFTPLDNVGLIVLDEEQDYSYKQDESPRYHARVVAEQFAKFHNAALVLGSATPSLETYYRAKSNELTMLSMPHRIGDHSLPDVKCVDMRKELKFGNKDVMSRALSSLLKETTAHHQQAILLLNRRGYSTFVMCRACGEVITCHDCNMPMVYHTDGLMRCHRCDIEAKPPDICPKCGSRYIKYFGSGTQRLEQSLKISIPEAKILRMDRDTTNKKFAHQIMINKFKDGDYDILFGTQMVAKGHDIDNVTAVGIISADSSLNIPDFRSSEQCFMLITQAAGRAGRAELAGKVIVQAYNPEHEAVIFGCKQDYDGFCEIELPQRQSLFYPPYSRLIKLTFVDKNEDSARFNAQKIVDAFTSEIAKPNQSEILGPAPAIVAKLKDIYRFVVLIKTVEFTAVHDFLRRYELNTRIDVVIDIDPITML